MNFSFFVAICSMVIHKQNVFFFLVGLYNVQLNVERQYVNIRSYQVQQEQQLKYRLRDFFGNIYEYSVAVRSTKKEEKIMVIAPYTKNSRCNSGSTPGTSVLLLDQCVYEHIYGKVRLLSIIRKRYYR